MLSDYPATRLVCISAGGNDFAGIGDLDDKILAADCSAASAISTCYRPGQPGSEFGAVEHAYRDLLDAVRNTRPDVTVLVHNYDYAVPDGRTLLGLRSWLKLPMDKDNDRVFAAGAPLGGMRRDLVRDFIDNFTLCLEDVCSSAIHPKAELVCGHAADDEWANELHPRPRAFQKLVGQCWSGLARRALGF